jgi:hypothetical protein
MIPLIQGLRKTRQTIKTVYNTSFQFINKMGDNESIVEIDAMREYTSYATPLRPTAHSSTFGFPTAQIRHSKTKRA